MRSMRTALLAAAMAIVLLPSPRAAAKGCIDWPRLMSRYEISLMPEKGEAVLITSFTNFTKKPEDDWLSEGIRDYLADLMRSSEDLKVLSGTTARQADRVTAPKWKVSGRFQRAGAEMKVYVSIFEGSSGKLLKQLAVGFPYPDNTDFFRNLAQAASDLMGEMKAKWDSGNFKSVRDATASTSAFESYSKGRQILEEYNPSTAAGAGAHFKDAVRLDFRSPLGYEGLIAMYTFLGFANKQNGQPYGSYYQQAEAELVKMKQLAKPAPAIFAYISKRPQRKRKPDTSIDNRFIESNASYMEAQYSSKLGNLKGAAKALERSVELVPEDAAAWQQLARIYSQMGDTSKSGEALRKANELNPCL